MKVKIYTSKHEEIADYVRCCNCGREMLVRCGTDDCPACKSCGTLMWVNEREPEVRVSEFKERERKNRITMMEV